MTTSPQRRREVSGVMSCRRVGRGTKRNLCVTDQSRLDTGDASVRRTSRDKDSEEAREVRSQDDTPEGMWDKLWCRVGTW